VADGKCNCSTNNVDVQVSALSRQGSSLEKDFSSVRAAVDRNASEAPGGKAVSCNSIDVRAAQVGTKCLTGKGAIFERVKRTGWGEAWKGPDDLIWSDMIGEGDFNKAEESCKKLGGRVPSAKDFSRGDLNGIRELLPKMKGFVYWSSSPHPDLADYAFAFYGSSGDINRYFRNSDNSVRCVVHVK
jgi:hypothetical protein